MPAALTTKETTVTITAADIPSLVKTVVAITTDLRDETDPVWRDILTRSLARNVRRTKEAGLLDELVAALKALPVREFGWRDAVKVATAANPPANA